MANITPEIEKFCSETVHELAKKQIRVFRYTRNKDPKKKTFNLEIEMMDDMTMQTTKEANGSST